MMYGDLVTGLWWCIVVPVHARDLWIMDKHDPLLPGARIAYFALVAACILTLSSIFTGKILLSRLAFCANVFAMSATNLLEFPFPGECTITPMMVGGTFLGVLANVSLAFLEKMMRLPVYFAAGSYVCINSPYCSYSDDTRPILGGTVMLEMIILCVAHYGGVRKILKHLDGFEMSVAHLARLVLAFLFLHHLATTLLQLGDHSAAAEGIHRETPEQFFVLVQAGVIACVGIAATGAFQDEINSKERAERIAKEESMMSKAMADSMMVLTHELRTPLQGIMGATSMLLSEKSDHNDSESLKLIMASSGLLLNLINNMLDVKRITEGMMDEFPVTSLSASEPIREAIGFCLPLASISNVNIVVDYGVTGIEKPSTEHAVVRSNALRLQQVLINLISNAIKYTNADGQSKSVICVSLRETTIGDVEGRMGRALTSSRAETSNTGNYRSDQWAEKSSEEKTLVFSVSDCGPGIDTNQAHRLFRRFGRLDNKPKRTLGGNTVGQPSGTGLGLHLCELFVQRMGGQIWATNNNKNRPGATFSFCLPLGFENTTTTTTKQHHRKLATMKQPRPSTRHRQQRTNDKQGLLANNFLENSRQKQSFNSSTVSLDGNNGAEASVSSKTISVFERRVLVVDDILINRKILHRMLKQIGFTKLCTVGSGQAALTELYQHRYDLVITDLQMPQMNGMELSEAIHKIDDEFFQTPVVVGLTADTCPETVERCKCSGMSEVIHKPITVEELRDFFDRQISPLIDANQNTFLEP